MGACPCGSQHSQHSWGANNPVLEACTSRACTRMRKDVQASKETPTSSMRSPLQPCDAGRGLHTMQSSFRSRSRPLIGLQVAQSHTASLKGAKHGFRDTGRAPGIKGLASPGPYQQQCKQQLQLPAQRPLNQKAVQTQPLAARPMPA